jgi:hypothetical protein
MTNTPQVGYLGRLATQLSTDRLAPYIKAASGDMEMALARYYWNAELCRAYYPLLQALEIALRNNLDRAISTRYPLGAPYRHVNSWIDRKTPVAVHPGAEASIERAKKKLNLDTKEGDYRRDHRAHGDLVASMSFGFWVALLGTTYDKGQGGPNFWFPGADSLPPTAFERLVLPSAKDVHMTSIRVAFNELRHFRNRVFHHEPVWPKREGDPTPKERYDSICRALRWLGGEQAQIPPSLHKPPELLDADVSIPVMRTRLIDTIDLILERARRAKEEKAARRAARSAVSGDQG